jgi:hypothetical protein
MRAVCVVASLLAGASADIGGCVLDPSAPNACREGVSLADSASLLQVKATERVQDQSEAAALTHNAAVTERCSDSADDPCQFTPWTAWSGCTKTCGTGIETRTRQTTNPEKCKKECIKEAQSCNVSPCDVPILDGKMCQIYGDPHVIAFDGHMAEGDTAQLSQDGLGVLWAVKSDDVKIQIDASEKTKGPGTGTGWGRSTGLAFDGYGHRLVWLKDGKKTLFDGQEIVKENGTTYKSDDGLIEVEHMQTLDPNAAEWKKLGYGEVHISDKVHGREVWAWRLTNPNDALFKIIIYFSEGDSLCAIIRMPKVDGMDGLCGNFDDNRANDVLTPHQAASRYVVAATDPQNMFAALGPGPGLLEEENRVVSRRTMEECEPELKKTAEETCAEIKDETLRHDCVYDICTTGELQDEEDEVEQEVLNSVVSGLP